jgi:hypothetical protein
MLDLFEHYITSQITCDIEAVAVGIADVVNGNRDESIAYADGFISQLSYPLSCVRIIIEMSSNLVNSTYTQVVSTVKNAQNSSPACDSFNLDISTLKVAVFEMFNRIATYTLRN